MVKFSKKTLIKIAGSFICVVLVIGYNSLMMSLYPDTQAPVITLFPLILFAIVFPFLIWKYDILKFLYKDDLIVPETDFIHSSEITDSDAEEIIGVKYDYELVSDGIEFEYYIAKLLTKLGYDNVQVTQASNDYGIDVTAEKFGIIYALQCKFYSSPVGVSAIQEVSAGKTYYKANVGVVVTNNRFTSNAIELANKTDVVLWDGEFIKSLSLEYDEMHALHRSNATNDISVDLESVIKYVIEEQKASTSMIQRKYRVGYFVASEIVEELEAKKIIGGANGQLPRSVLFDSYDSYISNK